MKADAQDADMILMIRSKFDSCTHSSPDHQDMGDFVTLTIFPLFPH
jgi:hypothetical protein